MAGIDRSSCVAATYPWLVRVNLPVVSNELVPSTQYTAPWWISALAPVYVSAIWVAVAAHSWPWALAKPASGCRRWFADPALRQEVNSLRPAAPHSSPSGIGPFRWGAGGARETVRC